MSRFLPPEYDKGDEGTIGGYAAVHGRPAALEGRDGMSYSVAILTDRVESSGAAGAAGASGESAVYGAYFLFPRWRRIGEEGVEGHLETPILEIAADRQAAVDALGAWSIDRVQRALDALIDADAAASADGDDEGTRA